MIEFRPLRWVLALLICLLFATTGGSATLAEHGDFASCAIAAETPLARIQGTFEDIAEQHLLPQFRSLDPNLKAGYTGSSPANITKHCHE